MFLCLEAFTFFVLGVIWVSQIFFLESTYKSIKTDQIQQLSKELSQQVDSADFGDMVSKMAQDNDICIRVFQLKAADVRTMEDGLINHLEVEELYSVDILSMCSIHSLRSFGALGYFGKARNAGGTALEWREIYFSESANRFVKNSGDYYGESVVCSTLVEQENGDEWLLLLDTVVTPMSGTVAALSRQLLLVSVIAVAVSALVAYWLSQFIARPIVRINNEAKRLAQGRYHRIETLNNYQEVQELSETLDHASAELKKEEKLRQELIANVSHDLRTPLTMIAGYAEMIRDIPGENTPENVQMIIEESKHLSTLVSDILDLSRLQSGARVPHPEVFSITQDIQDISQRYRHLVREDIVISFTQKQEVLVNADRTEISQVIYNLLNNAVAHTNTNSVLIEQVVREGWVIIRIVDYGDGIEAEMLPYIWDRYYKGKHSRKRMGIGTGLGLSISRSILESHKARYGVISALGEGSTFWFSLPVVNNSKSGEKPNKKNK